MAQAKTIRKNKNHLNIHCYKPENAEKLQGQTKNCRKMTTNAENLAKAWILGLDPSI